MKLTKIRQIIKEELEVILTNEEVGDLFGADVQRKLEEDTAFDPAREQAAAEVTASEDPGGDVERIATESNAADAADELTGRVPDAHLTQVIQGIEDLLHDPELSQGLSDEQRNELETILNFILKGRMGEAKEREEEGPDEEELQRRTSKAVKSSRRMRQRAKEQGITNIDRTPFGRHLAKKAKED